MQSLYSTNSQSLNLAGKTIVLPIVSSANVSQLAVDLLIASLGLKRRALFDPTYFIPVVGARDDEEPGITTPMELYSRDDLDIVIFQQRSPVLKSRKDDFVKTILALVQESKASSVLFLAGVSPVERTDSQMHTPTYQLISSGETSLNSTRLGSLRELPIPTYSSPVMLKPGEPRSSIPFIPEGGLTRRILASLPSSWNIPTATLLQFVLEGDNRADASLFAAVVAKVLSVDGLITQWKQPLSWQQGLFGAPPDQQLYG